MRVYQFRTHHAGYFLGPLGVAANIMYAGMRAQNIPETSYKRKIAFIFGFPTSIISYFMVEEGSCRAYGIELPRKVATSKWTEIGRMTGPPSSSANHNVERRTITVVEDE